MSNLILSYSLDLIEITEFYLVKEYKSAQLTASGGAVMEQIQGLPPQHVAYCLEYDTNLAHYGFLQELEDLLEKHGTISGSVKKQAIAHSAAAALRPLEVMGVQV